MNPFLVRGGCHHKVTAVTFCFGDSRQTIVKRGDWVYNYRKKKIGKPKNDV